MIKNATETKTEILSRNRKSTGTRTDKFLALVVLPLLCSFKKVTLIRGAVES